MCALIAPILLKDLGRGCTEKLPLPCVPLPGPRRVCLAPCSFQVPLSLLCKHLTSEINCSWVTCIGGLTFLAHFRAWGKDPQTDEQEQEEGGSPFVLSLGTDREGTPAHFCAAPGSQPFIIHPPCSVPFLLLLPRFLGD